MLDVEGDRIEDSYTDSETDSDSDHSDEEYDWVHENEDAIAKRNAIARML